MARRGFGSIRLLPSGKWQIRYAINGQNYVHDQRFRSDVRGKRDLGRERAEKELVLIERSAERGTWEPPGSRPKPAPTTRLTVAQLTRRYLNDRKASPRPPTQRTLSGYEDYQRLYIDSTPLGGMAAADVDFRDVESWQRDLLTRPVDGGRKPLSENSVIKVRSSLLAPAFKWATSRRSGPLLDARNPVADALAPKPDRSFRRAILYDESEYGKFLAACRRVDPNWSDMVIFVAVTGLRAGEYRQLRGEHVDPDRNVITVAERVTDGVVERGGKNGDVRDVPVPAIVMDKIVRPRLSTPDAFVFVNAEGRQWVQPTEYDRWVKAEKMVAAQGLQRHITPHSLRTSYKTYLASQRIHPHKIDAVMGHRDGSVAARYTQLSPEDFRKISEAVTPLVEAVLR